MPLSSILTTRRHGKENCAVKIFYIVLAVLAALVALLFTIYYFNLDMKLVSVIYTKLGRKFDAELKETKI